MLPADESYKLKMFVQGSLSYPTMHLLQVTRSRSSGRPPLMRESQLAERLREAAPPYKASTLWEMAGYGEREGGSKFVVSALDLPTIHHSTPPSPVSQPSPATLSDITHSPHPSSATKRYSPQPSPATHSHISHSPQPSPVAHSHISHAHSPQSSPVAHSHIYHSPQPSPTAQPHISRSPQAHSHAPHSPRPSHMAHTLPSRPPTLPRGVRTLLSDLSSLIGSQLCSDVVITVADGRGIPAHSAILACRCPILVEVRHYLLT